MRRDKARGIVLKYMLPTMLLWLFMATGTWAISCERTASQDQVLKEAELDPVLSVSDRTVHEILDSLAVHSDLSVWVSAVREVIPDFSVRSMGIVGTSRLNLRALPDADPRYWEATRLALVYSPDGRWGIDFHSAFFTMENGKWVAGWDADTFVRLYDLTKNCSYRLLMSGPSGGFPQAVWVDRRRFVVVGSMLMTSQSPSREWIGTTLYFFDLDRQVLIRIAGPEVPSTEYWDVVRPRLNVWRRAKFPEIKW